jgi:outer membrane protein
MRPAFPVLAVLVGAFLAAPAAAGDDLRGSYSTFFHFGSSYVKQADVATLFAGGAPVAGAGFVTEGDQTMAVEAGIFLRGGWAIAASGTIPTTISNLGTGTLAGLGNLGDENVGYYSATAQYHFNLRGPISPYVGAGIGYMHVFGTTDGAVTDMNVASASGPVLQAGIDFHLNERAGLYVDVKRFWISTDASGSLGGTPITAEATVDPWVFSTGVGIRF